MAMYDQFIKNTMSENMQVRYTPGTKGLTVFMMHGRSGNYNNPHNAAVASALQKSGFATFEINATNSQNNPSAGSLSDFSMDKHRGDLRDAINYTARFQRECYTKPFAIAAHSMGATAAVELVNDYKDDLAFLILYSPVISGARLKAARYQNQGALMKEWEKKGTYIEAAEPPFSQPGTLPWAVWNEWEKHDISGLAQILTMPTLVIAGKNDIVTPADDSMEFAALIQHPRARFVLIEGADHEFHNCHQQLHDAVHDFTREM